MVDHPMLEKVYALDSPQACEEVYDAWAAGYDRDMLEGMGYVSPPKVAAELAAIAPATAHVLDVGCGTGQVGELLAGHGFGTIDGLDISTAMLEVARGRGVYRELVKADLTARLPLADDAYDAVVSSGTFTSGHVGPAAFDELVRVLRPGSPIVVTVLDEIWEPQDFPGHIARLTDAGLLSGVRTTETNPFEGDPAVVRICVLTVT